MKKKKAKQLAIEKWVSIVKFGEDCLNNYTVTEKMDNEGIDCSYCYKYNFKQGSCKNCPIAPVGYNFKSIKYGCLYEKHPFNDFINLVNNGADKDKISNAAEKVLQLIKDN
jgi:hypothetical protein